MKNKEQKIKQIFKSILKAEQILINPNSEDKDVKSAKKEIKNIMFTLSLEEFLLLDELLIEQLGKG